MPLQILHLIAELNGYGETRQLRLLVQQQLAAGYQVRVVALSADAEVRAAFEALPVECCVLHRRWVADPIAAWRLSQEWQATGPDLIHTWGETALNYGLAVRSEEACPLVSTLFEAPRSTLWNACRKAYWGHAARTVVPSRRVEQDCRTHGFPEETTTVIPLSVAGPTASEGSREQFLAELGVSTDTQLIAIAGPLVRSKRIEDAIWCFELVRTLEERVRLVIFGDGPDRHRLERYVRLVSEAEAVDFLGYRADMLEQLKHVEVLWQPGEETTLAGVMLEAMAAGVPVVASDVPVHREVIDEGHTGHLFPVGSRAGCARQTQRLLNDKAHTSKITTAAEKWASQRFSPTTAANAYTEIYQQAQSTSRTATQSKPPP
ncbi:MAG: glycosyltransferase family 4 protein [Planctomycetes bacterium]|nr:glycosyltransferase family 4 protein [Planctomycetota bacterium]